MVIQPPTLRQLRQDRCLTQADLAKKARITFSYVSKLEAGAKTAPSEPVVRRLAKALDVDPFVLRLDPDKATAHLAELAVAQRREAAAEAV
jgi:transcriptional regulator with XRE-family HTH domain